MVVDTKFEIYWGEWSSDVKFSMLMGLVYGKILGEIGEIFPNLLDLM